MNITKGRYWQQGLQLIDGCTPCSPGCDHCWSAILSHRTGARIIRGVEGSIAEGTARGYEKHIPSPLTNGDRSFNGTVVTHPERLLIPRKRKKPTVYAAWNDWCHESAPDAFREQMMDMVIIAPQHIYLFLTKRPQIAVNFWEHLALKTTEDYRNIIMDRCFFGLTICNQQEAGEKIPDFLQVPGKKFLSIEPCLGPIDFSSIPGALLNSSNMPVNVSPITYWRDIDAVIVGGETGPGARPMHPEWARSIRDQCAAAGVPFFFKQWGEWAPIYDTMDYRGGTNWGYVRDLQRFARKHGARRLINDRSEGWDEPMVRVGRKRAGRLLDGREHNDLPWSVKRSQ